MTLPPDLSSSRSSKACKWKRSLFSDKWLHANSTHQHLRHNTAHESTSSRHVPVYTDHVADYLLSCRSEDQLSAFKICRKIFKLLQQPEGCGLEGQAHLEDVDGGLVDGAHDGAAGVDGVAHRAHHDGGRARIQPRRRLILHTFTKLKTLPSKTSHCTFLWLATVAMHALTAFCGLLRLHFPSQHLSRLC